MRRPVAVLARTLASVAVLTSVVVVSPGSASAATAVTISPAEGDTAIRDTQQISVSGTTTGSRIDSAAFFGREEDGDVVFAEVAEGALNRIALPPSDFLRVDAGRITGRLTLPCIYAEPSGTGPFDPDNPCPTHEAVRQGWLQVVVSGEAGTSNELRVDYTRPLIRQYETATTTRIRVAFTEPVRHRQGELPADWSVTSPDRTVLAVEPSPGNDCAYAPGEDRSAGPSGCTRTLVLDRPIGEDERPVVQYVAGGNGIPLREKYSDFASNQVLGFLQARAVDEILPRVPSVLRIAGRTPQQGRVLANQERAVVEVGEITEGHVASVHLETGGGQGLQDADTFLAESTAGASGAQVQLPALPHGVHTLHVTARDANGNVSAERTVVYDLDLLAPQVVQAVVEDGAVRVRFDQDVTGENRTADWRIRLPERSVRTVEGSGSSRLLTVSAAPDGATLDYVPSAEQGRYVDAAGNPLPRTTDIRIGGLQLPVVLDPPAPVVTRETALRVSGTGQDGTTAQVFHADDPDTVVGASPVSGGQWAVDVALRLDRVNDLRVRLVEGAQSSGAATVQTITQDGTPPALRVDRPAGGEVLSGGSTASVAWTTSDANPGVVDVEITHDSGATWTRLGGAQASAGGLSYRVPAVDGPAQLRVVHTDRAGNARSVVTPPFAIDALTPSFTALTTALRQVTVTFSEPVSGPVGQWTVDGQPAVVRTVDGTTPTTPPTSVSRARVLVLSTTQDFGQDGRPEVVYSPTALSTAAGELRDQSTPGNGVAPADRIERAVDGIRPAAPRIEQVQGRAVEGGRVLGGSSTPTVQVGGVTPGHTLVVERMDATSRVLATGPDATAEGSSALLTSPRLPDDGEHRLRVVAVDPTGNRSTDGDKSPPSADGSPSSVLYVLDSRVPAIAFAVLLDDTDFLEARFTQAVTGPNSPADWRVVDAAGRPVPFGSGTVTVIKVEGDGDRRRLQAAGARAGDLLVYDPQGGRYTNAAGAVVGDARVPLLALAPPIVATPARAVFVRATTAEVGGTADPGTTVQVLRRGAGGDPAGAPLVSAPVDGNGAWSARVPLRTDEAHDLLARVLRQDGRTSVAVPVPTITQDAVAPVLSADGLPGSGAVLQGGSAFEFRWTVSDRNLGLRPMVLEHSADGGRTWQRLEPEPVESANDPSAVNRRTVRLPSTATEAAVLRLTATDLAGNTSAVASRTFTQTGVRDVRRFACPPDRVQPAGFVDTADSTFRFEIDCLAAYGFTRGVTPDRYAPLGDVTRAQMAVFVARLARYGGLQLDTRDQGFTDLGASPQETRDAVNGLAALGVVEGTGGGRYEPAGRVTRAQMASFLARLQRSIGAPFSSSRDAFDDDARDVHEANINAVAAAGVVQGTAFRTYQPRASITRQQMAGFLVRYVDGRIEAGEMPSRF